MSKPLCVIVGFGEGLGRALATKFASCGFDLALISRSKKNSAAAADAVAKANGTSRVRLFFADVTRPETLESTIATIDQEMGEIDLLIYNVRGHFAACEPLDMSYDALENVYREEVVGAFAAAKAVLPGMINRARAVYSFQAQRRLFEGQALIRSMRLVSLGCARSHRVCPRRTLSTVFLLCISDWTVTLIRRSCASFMVKTMIQTTGRS